MLILRFFFRSFRSGKYIHQCAPEAPDWSNSFPCIYRRRAFLRQTFHIRELGCFAGRFVCQKDNGSPLLMYHLRSEIHQPGIPGIGDKNRRIAFPQVAGKVKHVLPVASVIVYVGKRLPQDRIQKFPHTGRSS